MADDDYIDDDDGGVYVDLSAPLNNEQQVTFKFKTFMSKPLERLFYAENSIDIVKYFRTYLSKLFFIATPMSSHGAKK